MLIKQRFGKEALAWSRAVLAELHRYADAAFDSVARRGPPSSRRLQRHLLRRKI
jgi:hypothetical protein